VGKVEVTGKGVEPDVRLLNRIKLSKKKYFHREVLARDLERLTDYYTSQGYAFAEVEPNIARDKTKQVVDVNYGVRKGELVDFGRIEISGNAKTRDKVIRRQLKVVEGARYSKAHLERSVGNLRRLDYFEEVEMDTRKGEAADRMNVDVKLKEKATRFISAGAGFSTADQFFFQAQVAERNLFGRGQDLAFQTQLGSRSNRYTLKFTEPWLFDIPLSATIEAYNWSRDYDEFKKNSNGGKLSLSYPVWDYTRLYLSYTYDNADVSNVSSSAATEIQDQEGKLVTSAASSTLRRDSRDHTFLTTRGSDNSLMVDYAGGVLGGDSGYIKTVFNSSWFFPLFWDCVGFLHGKTGYIGETGGEVPIYERFYLGGINSIRSFGSGDVSPRDPETGDRIGGNKMVLFNAEFLLPILKQQGIRGVLFFDAGNAYDDGDNIDLGDLKYAVGGGIRWYSPMGPLRFPWGCSSSPVKNQDFPQKWMVDIYTLKLLPS
jgi:outer membrane protein insertion porin family